MHSWERLNLLPRIIKWQGSLNTSVYLALSWSAVPLSFLSSPSCSCVLFVFFSCCLEETKFRMISGFPDLAPAQCLGSGSSMSICLGFACADCPAPAVTCSASRLRFLQNFQATQAAISTSTTTTEITIATIMVVRLVMPGNKLNKHKK